MEITQEELHQGINALNITIGCPISQDLLVELHRMGEKDSGGMIAYKDFLSKFKVVDQDGQ
jgi:hypothetical protein